MLDFWADQEDAIPSPTLNRASARNLSPKLWKAVLAVSTIPSSSWRASPPQNDDTAILAADGSTTHFFRSPNCSPAVFLLARPLLQRCHCITYQCFFLTDAPTSIGRYSSSPCMKKHLVHSLTSWTGTGPSRAGLEFYIERQGLLLLQQNMHMWCGAWRWAGSRWAPVTGGNFLFRTKGYPFQRPGSEILNSRIYGIL